MSKTDVGRVKAEVDTAEGVLQNAVAAVERARVISAQGATGTATAATRATLAGQLGDILSQLVGISNTAVEGRNIFAGDSDQAPAFAIDFNQPVPTGAYLGTPATRQIRHPDGSLFSVSKTAGDIFDSPNPGESIFASINAIRFALLNNDETAINAAVPDLETASQFLNRQHAFYGSAQSKVNGALDYADKGILRLQTQIGAIEDADPIQAAVELNQAILQQTASLQSRGRLPRTTLFDFLG